MNIKDYIQDKRHGKEANLLERDAMNDPFLQDAIDGFDSVQGNHLPVIEELENRIQINNTSKTPNFKRIWILGIAASLLFIVGIGTILRMYNLPENKLAHQAVPTVKQVENRVAESIESNLEVQENIITEKTIAQNITSTEEKTSSLVNNEVIVESVINNEAELLSEEVNEAVSIVTDGISDKKFSESNQNQVHETISDQEVHNGTVSGVVLDETGQPLLGVSVKNKNGQNSTITDINGRFKLVAPKNEQLVASYIGYEKKEITITDDSAIIQLKPDNLALNEVVVIGNGNIKAKSMAYSNVNVEEAVQGRTAGIEVSQKSGKETFGEYEFKEYFEKNRNKTICENKPNSLTAVFLVDLTGKPINIKVTACNCKELENEFLRLINIGPLWSKVNRNVYITIRLK